MRFVKSMYWNCLALALMFVATAQADAPMGVEQTRAALVAILDRPRVPLAAEENRAGVEEGIVHNHFVYSSEAGQRVPGILLAKESTLKDGAKHPVVIIQHGTGGKKEGNLPMLKRMAGLGFIAVGVDGRFHGERGTPADYNAAIAQAYADGKSHPLYFDTVWDLMRLVDYLQSRPDVDGARIGLMGISKGGIETWLTAAADTRIAVAVPCIALQSFQWGLDNYGWKVRVGTVQKGFDAAAKGEGVDAPDAAFAAKFYDRLLPGIRNRFDGPNIVRLIVPRPMLGVSGEHDPNNPLPGVRLCEQSAKEAYAAAGVPEKFNLLVEANAAHTVTAEGNDAAAEWFTRWLKP